MTTEPEMTLERAKQIIAEYEKPHTTRTIEETVQCQRAIGFLSGVKSCENTHTISTCSCEAYKALVKELVEALEHCRNRPHEHNPLPEFTMTHCEVIDRALESARRIPQMTHTIIDKGEIDGWIL